MYKWLLVLILLPISASAAKLDDYLKHHTEYSNSTPKPADSLGYEVGDWHARPEQLFDYYKTLAAQSDRVTLLQIGKTHEQRPLLLLFISSPENLKNLETLRQQHLAGAEDAPMVTWLGFSIHGNEPSGANAAPLVAYHLAAGQGEDIVETLNDQIVIIDPMLNPDGLARFAHWANMYKSRIPNADPNTMEHNESWPRGRTNHYWFDLNRDWLPVQHPESQARVTQFQRWRPHVLTDHHEMGKDKTFFFQPGVPSRQNPLTDPENFKMTQVIAGFHAKALDKTGSLYYSKEGYDDFYYGKGATYPDPQGGIGILFEQASVRGHAQQTSYGVRTFPEAIRNQFTVALSTIQAVQNNQSALKAMRRSSQATAAELIAKERHAGVVLKSQDAYRLRELTRILTMHNIQFATSANEITVNRETYPKGSLIVPFDQDQYRLAKSLFEVRSRFEDNVFYDVSTWNLAYAMDLQYAPMTTRQLRAAGQQQGTQLPAEPKLSGALAVAIDWQDMGAARALSQLLQHNIQTVAVTKPTELKTPSGTVQLSLGSLIVPLSNDPQVRSKKLAEVKQIAQSANVPLIAITSGFAQSGVDMGSPSILPVPAVNPLLLIGGSVRSYDAGEVWHFLDQRLQQPVTMMTLDQFKRLKDLSAYTHVLMPDGRYNFSKQDQARLKTWVEAGGHIIATARASEWLTGLDWLSSEPKTFSQPLEKMANYAEKAQVDAKHVVGGAIAAGVIDTTHPIGFGLDDQDFSFFKRGTLAFSEPRESFVAVARFQSEPHRAGYMSTEVAQHLSGAPAIVVQRLGRGRLIAFADNPLFRAYWLGTMRTYANALYFAPLIQAPTATRAIR